MIAPRLRRDPQRFKAIEASMAESSDLKTWLVFIGSNQTDDQQHGRTPVGTCPVRLHDTPFRTASGGGGVKGSMPNKGEDSVFVRGVHTLVFESLIGTDAVWVAGGCLCVFHSLKRASIARRSPRGFPHGLPRKIQTDSTKCRRPDPWAGIKTARWPALEPAQARQSEQGSPTRSLAHSVSME